jgi:hypothetical protein
MDDELAAAAALVSGAWRTLALRAMVRLRIADLAVEPVGLAELAVACGCPPERLVRLLRVLEDAGVVRRDGAAWQVTERGSYFALDHPAGQGRRLLARTWAPTITAWSDLSGALQDGERRFGRVDVPADGTTMWEALSAAPAELATFNAQMAGRGQEQAHALREAADLDAVRSLVDVGGGKGSMVAALLAGTDGLTATVADRPDVVREAAAALAEAGLDGRADVEAVDFFEWVPPGADAYVLANVLHDWGDDECVRILRVIRAAMPDTSRLWLLEKVLDATPPRTGREAADLHLLDLHMLVLFGAAERTAGEYAGLLVQAGFAAPTCRHTSTGWDLVEARPLGAA